MATTLHEINLLPPQRRRLLQRGILFNALRRLLQTCLAAVASMTAVALIIMAILYVVGNTTAGPTSSQYQVTNKQYQDLRIQVDEQNQYLKSIQLLGNQKFHWSDFILGLLKALPSGVTVNSMDVTTTTAADGLSQVTKLVMIGRAASRDTLGAIEGNLRRLKNVTQVDSPTSNLIERVNPSFTYMITVDSTGNGAKSLPVNSGDTAVPIGGKQTYAPVVFPSPPPGSSKSAPFQIDGWMVLVSSSVLLAISGGILLGKRITGKKNPVETPREI